ncbi:MAG: glycosyl transferase [Deltaproteobacteria bacterium]|nr:glycosyl transferase [Deltaproteobacteria bacterium]
MKRSMAGIEFIVGIPSFREADGISFVTRQVDIGLSRYFSALKTVIVNVDNHSDDDTRVAFLRTETQTPKHYITTPLGVRGKGNNFLNLFKFGATFNDSLKGAVVVDADLKSITPEWIKFLGEPILKGYDYALPRYSRHQFDGSITNHICYPLLYGLLGEDIRQPIGGEFGFSPALMHHWLKQKWTQTTRQYGIDIFMTLNAVLGGFRICEVGLGAKVHKASAPKLGPMFTQVVTTLFDFILSRKEAWLKVPVVSPKPMKQFGLTKLDPPQELKINIRGLKEQLQAEYEQRERLLRKYLNDYAIMSLENMFEQDYYSIDILMWTQVVYQLLFTYDMGARKVKADIVEALKPLYFARSVTFDYMTWRYDVKYAEETILGQAKAFASQKPYLLGLYLKGETEKRRRPL